jgi:hypothetical protein
VKAGNLKMIETLDDWGADEFIENHEGDSALSFADKMQLE